MTGIDKDIQTSFSRKLKESAKIQEALDVLLAEKESSEIEFKSAKGGFPGSFWETYSSFANTNGGIIILGVKEKNGVFSVDDIDKDTIYKYRKEFFDNQNSKDNISQPLLTDKDVVVIPYGDRRILAFVVPRASREFRPVYKGANPMTGTYRRDGEGDYLCSPTAVTQMFADRAGATSVESRILQGFTMDDIDMQSFRQYRTMFANLTPSHPWVVLDDLGLMKKLGAYRRDRIIGNEGFTVAGILMFGKTESITDPDCLPDFMVDYREIPADTSVVRWTDRIYPDGTWEANLFQFYRLVLPKIQASLPRPFKLEANTRIDESPAHVALREAFVNCCVHAAYGMGARLLVTKTPNSILFSNPGMLLVSMQQYYEGGYSECRNPALQNMFALIGSSDKAGSGVDKILKGWENAHWRRPYIVETSLPDKVELMLPMESLFSAEVLENLKERFGKTVESLDLDRLSVLATACLDGEVSNSCLQYSLDLHPSDITKLLKDLCKDGFLESSGFGRGTVYHLRACTTSNDTSSNDTSSNDTSSNDTSSNDISLEDSAGVAGDLKQCADGAVTSGSRYSRADYEDMAMALVKYCITWRSAKDIAYALGRSSTYTRRVLLKRFIRDGLIEPKYPDRLNHPGQMYRNVRP